ncbi:MAG: alanine--tRNA ligase, partial [Dehalococcoidia bacterium]
MRVVAEHSRAITFLIADGVIPSNEGRGYVLRRVLNRAVLYGHFGDKLDIRKEGFLAEIASEVIDKMQHIYPDLKRNESQILSIIGEEETRVYRTLGFGTNLLYQYLEDRKSNTDRMISGPAAFQFYDTYGLPKEVLAHVTAEKGFEINWEGFESELDQQRARARAAQKFGLADKSDQKFWESLGLPHTEFVGYDSFSQETKVLGLIVEGQSVQAAVKGQEVEVILAQTPFYGEMGGQLGDTGEIVAPAGKLVVGNTIRPIDSLVAHLCKVAEGVISVGDTVQAKVNLERRMDIARNHTATHLLHAALRKVLGEQVRQGGSLVTPDHFRFDFAHLISLSKEELAEVQHIVNENIRRNLAVSTRVMSYKQAVAEGALAFFGEKYGDEVRLVQIKDTESGEIASAELCGGTHLRNTGQIGFFHITSEKSVGSGLRRIEAITGKAAEAFAGGCFATLESVAAQLETSPSEIQGKLAALVSELNTERKRARELESQLLRKTAESLLSEAVKVDGMNVLAAKVAASDMELLRQMGDFLRDKLGSGVIVLGAVLDGNPRFLAMVTPDLVKKKIHAGNIVKQVAQIAGGGGGGKPEMAQAGGKDASKIDEALKIVPKLIGKV